MASAPAIQVLLVEGDDALERFLREALEKEGLGVRVTRTAAEALALVAAHEPPVVVSEIGLEGGASGFELVRRVREVDPLAECILLTASDDPRMTIAAVRAGATDVVHKASEGVAQLVLSIRAAEERRLASSRRGRAVRDLVALGDELAHDLPALIRNAVDLGVPPMLAEPGGPYRVLIVDDEPTSARALVNILEGGGYVVESATSAAEALPLLEGDRFQMLVVDKNLGVSDGLELLRAVRERGLRLAKVLMTGQGALESATAAMEAGAGAYLTKPFEDVDDVLRRLDALRARAEVSDARERGLDAFRRRMIAFGEDFGVIRADLAPRPRTNGKSAK